MCALPGCAIHRPPPTDMVLIADHGACGGMVLRMTRHCSLTRSCFPSGPFPQDVAGSGPAGTMPALRVDRETPAAPRPDARLVSSHRELLIVWTGRDAAVSS